MKDFLIIMRANANMNTIPTPQDLEERKAWLIDVEQKGILTQKGGALPAMPQAVSFVYPEGKSIDGFLPEIQDFIVGFLVIKAADMNEAKAIAASNPLVKAGGSIEVREAILR